MGKRSRRRGGTVPASATVGRVGTEPPARAAAPRRRGGRPTIEDRPKPPWHPVPLVELAILSGLILVVAGFVVRGKPGVILITGGVGLVALASLELAIREHFTGYRSHSALLAGAAAVAILALGALIGLPKVAILLVAVIVGVAAFAALRGRFQRKAGGLTWRA